MKTTTYLTSVCIAASTALLLATAPTARAAEPVWGSKSFEYRAEAKRLPDVIKDFGAAVSVPVMVEAGVDGSVDGTFNSTPTAFMNAITRAYGVVWYFDGSTLFAYPANSVRSRIFTLRGIRRAQVLQALSSLGLGDSRYPLRFDGTLDLVVASGPPRHIEIIESVLAALGSRQSDEQGSILAVVPLKFAYAADRTSGDTHLPGMVSTLNGIFSSRSAAAGTTGVGELRPTKVRPEQPQAVGGQAAREHERSALEIFGLKSSTRKAGSLHSSKPGDLSAERGSVDAPSSARSGAAEVPTFIADEATNSVVIRASANRMPQIEMMIKSLDVAQDLVEMEVTIIDVGTDEFEGLGIQWGYSSDNRGVQVSSSSVGGVVPNITTLITHAGRELLSKIRLLEGSGKANILSRPKVLGAANRMSSMIDKRKASIRVAGNLDANLFTIETGTTVQFQPQIVGDGGKRDVRLTLYIADGNFEGQLVDQVPIIKQTEIRTDATVPEGESLLIGGISLQSTTQSQSGVPGLSRLGLFGGLFRGSEVKTTKSERLFLLTPKIIKVNGSTSIRREAQAQPDSNQTEQP